MRTEDSFIVKFWSRIFNFLRWISVFQIIRHVFGKKKANGENRFVKTYTFVELWVIGNAIVSIILLIIVKNYAFHRIYYLFLGYSLIRVFEIFVYQVNVLLFDQLRTDNYAIKSYRRMVLLLLHNFVEIILWFSISYLILGANFTEDLGSYNLIQVIYFSFVKMTSFGSTNLEPKTMVGIQIVWFQSIVGLFMTLIVLSRFIGLLPTPKSMDENEGE
ncbi:hypothetical protein SAMN05192551_10810 [Tindallia magadiensis]|uniref:Ion channel n=1 Tax=Tindallia magadiensis TaxID=69895 RepID=A0A1I3G538_9FIRM|nr:hypothetical protein [Tindallia magadiensis]SFI18600.1 hypothetical protein SAMN05192551_10810 [Tindallia magadiensis]